MNQFQFENINIISKREIASSDLKNTKKLLVEKSSQYEKKEIFSENLDSNIKKIKKSNNKNKTSKTIEVKRDAKDNHIKEKSEKSNKKKVNPEKLNNETICINLTVNNEKILKKNSKTTLTQIKKELKKITHEEKIFKGEIAEKKEIKKQSQKNVKTNTDTKTILKNSKKIIKLSDSNKKIKKNINLKHVNQQKEKKAKINLSENTNNKNISNESKEKANEKNIKITVKNKAKLNNNNNKHKIMKNTPKILPTDKQEKNAKQSIEKFEKIILTHDKPTLKQSASNNEKNSPKDFFNFNQSNSEGNLNEIFSNKKSESSLYLKNSDKPDFNKILEKIKDAVKPPVKNEITIQLKPEHLGKIKIMLTMENNTLKGKIITEHKDVQQSILNNFNQLESALKEKGINLSNFNVTVDNEKFSDEFGNKNKRYSMSNRKKNIKPFSLFNEEESFEIKENTVFNYSINNINNLNLII